MRWFVLLSACRSADLHHPAGCMEVCIPTVMSIAQFRNSVCIDACRDMPHQYMRAAKTARAVRMKGVPTSISRTFSAFAIEGRRGADSFKIGTTCHQISHCPWIPISQSWCQREPSARNVMLIPEEYLRLNRYPCRNTSRVSSTDDLCPLGLLLGHLLWFLIKAKTPEH